MTEGYGDGRMALVGGSWNIPATAQLEQRIVAIEQLITELHRQMIRIEGGIEQLLTEIRDLG